MAATLWDIAGFEASPAGNTSRKLGDDRIRELKKSMRERMQAGGHYMTDPVSAYVKDGRHVVDAGGAGVSPAIYHSDAVTKLIDFTDTEMQFKAGMGVTSVDGIAGAALKAKAATNPVWWALTSQTISPTATVAVITTPITLGTPKGPVIWFNTMTFEASAINGKVAVVISFDYLNNGTWTADALNNNVGLLVPARTAALEGMITHSFLGYDPMTTPPDGGVVPMKIEVFNNHATQAIVVSHGVLVAVELRR